MRQPLSAMGYIKKVYETTENNSEELSSSNSGGSSQGKLTGWTFLINQQNKEEQLNTVLGNVWK